MNWMALLLLGLVAGSTIFIGLSLGRFKGLSGTWRGALSMVATGILVFLFTEIILDAISPVSAALEAPETGTSLRFNFFVVLFLVGFAIGLVGLVYVRQRFIRQAARISSQRLSLMIAAGIGLHNLSEGLAIGQSFLSGQIALAFSLVIGFALHNATEGFGIVGPMLQQGQRVRWREIAFLGAISGGPTFVGTLLGSLWTSVPLSIFVLAMAGGALLYVINELFSGVRKETAQVVIMSFVVVGFAIGWLTELVLDR
ncbi:MAG: ZIP family metal transporter [Firmicutes bacterium]|nr:ZIP family metal transporter [Bacillota bacterium]